MQRSSESVAALASALAKAQVELVNPEKSLTATITTGRSGERERTFRYAPLSSGLDIVRKILGQHEIATMQTTGVDQASGLVNLTTVLAHASGEWIASDWPVCPIAEMATPHRMGAALTYARRYALFTLVGIAGEDDLDAPDLTACGPAAGGAFDPRQGRLPSGQSGNGRVRGAAKSNAAVILDADKSAALREKLLAEIASLTSAEFAVTWATRALRAKNSLVAADAEILEEAFEQKLSAISPTPVNEAFTGESTVAIEMRPQEEPPASVAASNQPAGIDKSILMIAAPRRYRNREHLRYVTLQPCLLCGRKPSDAHHLRFVQPRALGRKASDEFAVPLCRIHHRAAHRASNERTWWKATGIDPLKVARKLWKDTRADDGQNRPNLSLQAARSDPPFTSDAIESKAP
jgi:ERF superfamily protein